MARSYADSNNLPVGLQESGPVDWKKQAYEVPGTKKPGQTGIWRNAYWKDVLDINSNSKFPKTLYESFQRGLSLSTDRPCFGIRPIDPKTGDFAKYYTWQTYAEVAKRITHVGSGLVHLGNEFGIAPRDSEGNGWRVGMWAHNRPEWQIVSKGLQSYSLVLVSVYDTLGEGTVEYCINHADIQVIFANPAHMPSILSLKKEGKIPGLKALICTEPLSGVPEPATKAVGAMRRGDMLKEWGRQVGLKVLGFDEIEALGAANPFPHIPPKPEDMVSICYTSGTTGNPKGAILTHASVTSAVLGNLHGGVNTAEDVALSFLPLSHIYERFIEEVTMCIGCPLGFACGDTLRLVEDMQILRPTVLVGVPRILNRLYQAVKSQTLEAPGVKGKLLNHVIDTKIHNLRTYNTVHHAVYDRLILRKVRAVLGGRIRMIGTGSAPVAPEVLDFLRVAFSCEIVEGYGQTESMGTTTRCYPGDYHAAGSTGPPQVCCEVKLLDVPDTSLSLVANCSYYHDEKNTKSTLDEEGWLHSGDVALIDAVGRVKIIDRIKNLVKLSQGEYVALEKIEGVYSMSTVIAQIYIHGDGLRDHIVAIIVPDPEKFAGKSHVAIYDWSNWSLDAIANKEKLRGFERVKAIHLTLEPFTIDNELLTPTMKVKRNIAAQYFRKQIDELYANDEKPKAKL
ncbi:acetyl-CoA synthetase-like protein [Atractiella rhizophila]|nr:acetyl-CoA synthetase-like protein [Atractiella rhizophila]